MLENAVSMEGGAICSVGWVEDGFMADVTLTDP